MKNIFLILASILLLSASCGGIVQTPTSSMPAKVTQEIWAISQGSISEDYLIAEIEDDGDIYRIYIELQFEPTSYAEVMGCTSSACLQAYAILENAGMKRDISVWARRTLSGGGVALYGRTYYSQATNTYDFKNIKELNL